VSQRSVQAVSKERQGAMEKQLHVSAAVVKYGEDMRSWDLS
jgi:hypothetical protein